MEIKLIGKKLSEFQKTDAYEKTFTRCVFPNGVIDHNFKAYQHRLSGDDFKREIFDLFIMNGNAFITSHEIIARVRVIERLNLLSDEQWERAIPLIERGIMANHAYVNMLDEISPIIERYCKEYKDVNMRYTFMERVHLECWQGRFRKLQSS